MPSGNATFTYTGPDETAYVSGETFTKGLAQLTHDNGVIGMIREREDFTEATDKPKAAKTVEPEPDAFVEVAAIPTPAPVVKPKAKRAPKS